MELADVINPRLKDDVIRELIAYAFLRTASQNGFNNINELHYTQEDVDFVHNRISHFIDFTINPLIAESLTHISKGKSKIEICMEAIMHCLVDRQWHTPEEIMSFVRSRFREIGREVGQATIYNALKTLKTLGKIDHQYGRYRIAGGETK